ncbi:MAG: IS110 family transposase [Holosporaceae bacterium]|jgi:transposase|nr:IS110 family transposase [Holosporaceae bacterium]
MKKAKKRFNTFQNSSEGFKKLLSWTDSKCQCSEKPAFCMEATGSYMEEVVEFLYDNGFDVSIVNPLLIKQKKAKLHSNKTDKADAKTIAKYCRSENPRLWTPQPQEYRQLRDVCRAIDFLKIQLTRERNKLETRVINIIVKNAINTVILAIEEQINKLEAERKKIIDEHEQIKSQVEKIVNIKGVGLGTACCILVEAPTPENFNNAKQYAAFFGITPQHFESGSSVKKGSHLSKIGSRYARKTLFMASMAVKRHNENFQPFVQRLEKKGKKAKVIVCAIMRKLMHIIFGMLKNNTNFNKNLAFAA